MLTNFNFKSLENQENRIIFVIPKRMGIIPQNKLNIKIMIGTINNISDAIVLESSALSSFVARYSNHIVAIDTTIVDGKAYFAVIGNGALLNNLGEQKAVYCTIPVYYYFRYFTYLNAYQVKMAAETFELCAYDSEDNKVLSVCGTPSELADSVKMLPNCFFTLSKGDEELHSGTADDMQDYFILLGSNL